MRKINLLATVSFQLGTWITLFTFLLVAPAFAATIYVSPGGGGSGTAPASPTTLQAALTTAQGNGEADTIYLMAGSYPTSGGPFSYNASQSDEVKLTGGWDTGFTAQYRGMDPASMSTLNGQNLNRVFEIRSEAAGVTVKFSIENIAFLNGLANVNAIHGAGLRSNCANGGIINLFVRRCLFENNNGVAGASNTSGGGIYTNGYAEIYDSAFSSNTARGGGAVYLGYAAPNTNSLESRVERCTFTNNKTLVYSCSQPGVPTCYDGGSDIVSIVSPIIRESIFSGDGTLSGGGAIDHVNGGNLRLINSTVSGKRSWFWGGGIHIWDANAEIYNSLISDNAAGQCNLWGRGGGIAIYDPSAESPRTVKVFNSTFVKNRSNGTNDGLVGMAIDNRIQALTVFNSIFWDNGATSPIYIESGSGAVTYSDVQGGFGGTGNINSNPGFVDFTNNNFHLTDGSPCKDTGTNNPGGPFLYTVYPTSSDRDGRRRILDGGVANSVDMGAYEFDNNEFAAATGRGDPNLVYDPLNKRYLSVYGQADGSGGGTVYGRLINPDGTPYAAEFPISEQKSYERVLPAAVFDAYHNQFVVVWDVFNGSTNEADLQGQLVNPDGTLNGWNFMVSNRVAASETRPALAYDDSARQTLVVWNSEFKPTNEWDVYGRFFIQDAAQGSDSFPVANTAAIFEGDPALAFDSVNNRFLVVWSDDRNLGTSGAEIYGQLFNSDRTLNGGNFSITENRTEDQILPSITFNPLKKQYLVVWEHTQSGSENDDVFGRLVNHNGTLAGTAFPISNTAAKQDSISVASYPLAGRFLAVWQDDRDGAAGRNIYGQWINDDGTLLDTNFPIVNLPNDQDYPKVAFGPGKFLVTYENVLAVNPFSLDVGFIEVKGPSLLFLPLILK